MWIIPEGLDVIQILPKNQTDLILSLLESDGLDSNYTKWNQMDLISQGAFRWIWACHPDGLEWLGDMIEGHIFRWTWVHEPTPRNKELTVIPEATFLVWLQPHRMEKDLPWVTFTVMPDATFLVWLRTNKIVKEPIIEYSRSQQNNWTRTVMTCLRLFLSESTGRRIAFYVSGHIFLLLRERKDNRTIVYELKMTCKDKILPRKKIFIKKNKGKSWCM